MKLGLLYIRYERNITGEISSTSPITQCGSAEWVCGHLETTFIRYFCRVWLALISAVPVWLMEVFPERHPISQAVPDYFPLFQVCLLRTPLCFFFQTETRTFCAPSFCTHRYFTSFDIHEPLHTLKGHGLITD